jgi:hypothetical protein
MSTPRVLGANSTYRGVICKRVTPLCYVKTGHKNNNNACVRDMQIEHIVNTLSQTLSQTVLSSLIG